MGFPRQEYWSGLPFPPPGDLPNPGIESQSPALQADSLPSEPPGKLSPNVPSKYFLELGVDDGRLSSALDISRQDSGPWG